MVPGVDAEFQNLRDGSCESILAQALVGRQNIAKMLVEVLRGDQVAADQSIGRSWRGLGVPSRGPDGCIVVCFSDKWNYERLDRIDELGCVSDG